MHQEESVRSPTRRLLSEAQMALSAKLRFGLVGTGPWARTTHAPALAAAPDIQLVGIWGRNGTAADALAAEYGAAAFGDIDDLLAAVDAVAFAVPPHVQCEIAIRAAIAGKHLLLEKPIATANTAADALVEAVHTSKVATVVFFTAQFRPIVRAWLTHVRALDGWIGGSALWLSPGLLRPSPSPWRVDKGGLWDLGPHAVSLLWAALGPVVAVSADAGILDVAHLVLHHSSGVTSTVTVTQCAPRPALTAEVALWGAAGRSTMPKSDDSPASSLQVALADLVANSRTGEVHHPCDVRFGRDVGRVLACAERQLATTTQKSLSPTGRLDAPAPGAGRWSA
jgi:predicted dehydrogenase